MHRRAANAVLAQGSCEGPRELAGPCLPMRIYEAIRVNPDPIHFATWMARVRQYLDRYKDER